jgi:hypothetical protein
VQSVQESVAQRTLLVPLRFDSSWVQQKLVSFPGMIFYLSFWYKPEERATRIAGFLCSATLAGAFGG